MRKEGSKLTKNSGLEEGERELLQERRERNRIKRERERELLQGRKKEREKNYCEIEGERKRERKREGKREGELSKRERKLREVWKE